MNTLSVSLPILSRCAPLPCRPNPALRLFRPLLPLSIWPALPTSKEQCSGRLRQRGGPHLGATPCRQAIPFRATFQELFHLPGAFLPGANARAHALLATSARGTPLRSGRAGSGTSPLQQTTRPPLVTARCPIPRSGCRRAPATPAPRRQSTDKIQARQARRRARGAGRNRARPEQVRRFRKRRYRVDLRQ